MKDNLKMLSRLIEQHKERLNSSIDNIHLELVDSNDLKTAKVANKLTAHKSFLKNLFEASNDIFDNKNSRNEENSHYFVHFPNSLKDENGGSSQSSSLAQNEVINAKQETYVITRINQLRKKGLWSASRLPKVMEPQHYACCHHQFLLDEVLWLAADFIEERKWKIYMASLLSHSAKAFLDAKLLRTTCSLEVKKPDKHRNLVNSSFLIHEQIETNKENVNSGITLLESSIWDSIHMYNDEFIRRSCDLGPSWFANNDNPENTINFPESDSEWNPPSLIESSASEMPSPFDRSQDGDSFLIEFKSRNPQVLDDSSIFLSSTSSSIDSDASYGEIDLLEKDQKKSIEDLLVSYSKIDSSFESINNEVSLLRSDADLPIQDSLPQGFQPYQNTVDESSKRPSRKLHSSSFHNTSTSSEASSTSIGSQEESDRNSEPFDKTVEFSSHMLLNSALMNSTCKISFLPTSNMTRCIEWLQGSFLNKSPSLLISSCGTACGDLETIVLTHLGRLTTLKNLNNESFLWGPHLIVTSKIEVPSWRLRIANICPGLNSILLSSDSTIDDFGGLTGRLKRKLALNQLNVCITNYGHIFSKPERFSKINWSTLILDKCDFLWISCDQNKKSESADNYEAQSDMDFPDDTDHSPSLSWRNGLFGPEKASKSNDSRLASFLSSLIASEESDKSISVAEWVQLFKKINCQNQRILLSRTELIATENIVNQQIIDLLNPNSLQNTNNSQKPYEVLQNFIYQLEPDDEWDSLICEKKIPCPLLASQQTVHDLILCSDSANNAIKTGAMLDVLSCASSALAVCSHPILIKQSKYHSASKIMRGYITNLDTIIFGPLFQDFYMSLRYPEIIFSLTLPYYNIFNTLFERLFDMTRLSANDQSFSKTDDNFTPKKLKSDFLANSFSFLNDKSIYNIKNPFLTHKIANGSNCAKRCPLVVEKSSSQLNLISLHDLIRIKKLIFFEKTQSPTVLCSESYFPSFEGSRSIRCYRDSVISPPPIHLIDLNLRNLCDSLNIKQRFSSYFDVSKTPCSYGHFEQFWQIENTSSKLQVLRNLLIEWLQSSSSLYRPRCIFLISHKIAFLRLVHSWIRSHWMFGGLRSNLCKLYDSKSDCVYKNVCRVNSWERGSKGPLIVLIHARQQMFQLSSLIIGPDCRTIILDADWRVQVCDSLNEKMHNWALNGLSDCGLVHERRLTQSRNCQREIGLIKVYRLMATRNYLNGPSSTLEQQILETSVLRLISRSAFLIRTQREIESVDEESCNETIRKRDIISQMFCNAQFQPSIIVSLFARCRPEMFDMKYQHLDEISTCSSEEVIRSNISRSTVITGDERHETDSQTPVIHTQLDAKSLMKALELFEDYVDAQMFYFLRTESLISHFEIRIKPNFLKTVTSGDQNFLGDILKETLDSKWSSFYQQNTRLFVSDFLLLPHRSIDLDEPRKKCLKRELKLAETFKHIKRTKIEYGLENNDPKDFLSYIVPSNELISSWQTSIDTNIPSSFVDHWQISVNPINNIPIWKPLSNELNITEMINNQAKESLACDWSSVNMVNQMTTTESPSDLLTDINLQFFSEMHLCKEVWGYSSDAIPEYELNTLTLPPVTYETKNRPYVGQKHSQGMLPLRHTASPANKRRRLANFSHKRQEISTNSYGEMLIPPRGNHQIPISGSEMLIVGRSPTQGYIGANKDISPAVSNFYVTIALYCGKKLYVPRASFVKDPAAMTKLNRVRRMNIGSVNSGISSTTAGSQLGQKSSIEFNGLLQACQSISSVCNVTTLYKYLARCQSHPNAIIQPAQQTHVQSNSISQNLSPQSSYKTHSSRYMTEYMTGGYCQMTPSRGMDYAMLGGAVPTLVGVNMGTPLDWFVHEDAALYYAIARLQGISLDTVWSNGSVAIGGGSLASGGVVSPLSTAASISAVSSVTGNGSLNHVNFRFSEHFINQYTPVRSYRGVRQCIAALLRMQQVAFTASTLAKKVIPNTTSTNQDESFYENQFNTTNQTTFTENQSGRKVKSKLKNTYQSNISISSGTPGNGSSCSQGSIPLSNTMNASVRNRYRGFVFFDRLYGRKEGSASKMSFSLNTLTNNIKKSSVANNNQSSSLSFNNQAIIAMLEQLSETTYSSESVQMSLLRRVIRETESNQDPVLLTPQFLSPQVNQAQFINRAPGATASGLLRRTGSPATIPNISIASRGNSQMILTNATTANQRSLTSIERSVTGSAPGNIVQKNPSHISVLQECNINPDSLITPAMVLKSKEEREAQLRQEKATALLTSRIQQNTTNSLQSSPFNISTQAQSVCHTPTLSTTGHYMTSTGTPILSSGVLAMSTGQLSATQNSAALSSVSPLSYGTQIVHHSTMVGNVSSNSVALVGSGPVSFATSPSNLPVSSTGIIGISGNQNIQMTNPSGHMYMMQTSGGSRSAVQIVSGSDSVADSTGQLLSMNSNASPLSNVSSALQSNASAPTSPAAVMRWISPQVTTAVSTVGTVSTGSGQTVVISSNSNTNPSIGPSSASSYTRFAIANAGTQATSQQSLRRVTNSPVTVGQQMSPSTATILTQNPNGTIALMNTSSQQSGTVYSNQTLVCSSSSPGLRFSGPASNSELQQNNMITPTTLRVSATGTLLPASQSAFYPQPSQQQGVTGTYYLTSPATTSNTGTGASILRTRTPTIRGVTIRGAPSTVLRTISQVPGSSSSYHHQPTILGGGGSFRPSSMRGSATGTLASRGGVVPLAGTARSLRPGGTPTSVLVATTLSQSSVTMSPARTHGPGHQQKTLQLVGTPSTQTTNRSRVSQPPRDPSK